MSRYTDDYTMSDAANDAWEEAWRAAAPGVMAGVIAGMDGFNARSPRLMLAALLPGTKPSRSLAEAIAEWHANGRESTAEWAEALANAMDDDDMEAAEAEDLVRDALMGEAAWAETKASLMPGRI